MQNKAKQISAKRLAMQQEREANLSKRNKAKKRSLARAMQLANAADSYKSKRRTRSA